MAMLVPREIVVEVVYAVELRLLVPHPINATALVLATRQPGLVRIQLSALEQPVTMAIHAHQGTGVLVVPVVELQSPVRHQLMPVMFKGLAIRPAGPVQIRRHRMGPPAPMEMPVPRGIDVLQAVALAGH